MRKGYRINSLDKIDAGCARFHSKDQLRILLEASQ
jgi:hypothetical protein